MSVITDVIDIPVKQANQFATYNEFNLLANAVKAGVPKFGVAYVDNSMESDAYGIVGNAARPFKTIDAALDALTVAGITFKVVDVAVGDYASPTSNKITSNTAFRCGGAGCYDWVISGASPAVTTNPTKIIGGTVFKGSFAIPYSVNNFSIERCGIDVGSAWCASSNGIVGGTDALTFGQRTGTGLASGVSSDGTHYLQSTTPARYGIKINDIIILGKNPDAPFHALLAESLFAPQISRITTCYNGHGVVVKALGGTVSDIQAFAHAFDGLIIKSNDYAAGFLTVFTNINIRDINGAGGGIYIQGEGNTVGYFRLSNFNIYGTTYGIQANGDLDNIGISGGNISSCTGVGLSIAVPMAFSSFSDIIIRSCTGRAVTFNIASPGNGNTISDIKAIGNPGGGFYVSAGGMLEMHNCEALYNTEGANGASIQYGANVYTSNVYTTGTVSGTPLTR